MSEKEATVDITITDLRQRHIEEFLRARRDIRAGIADLTPGEYADVLVGFAQSLAKKKITGEEYAATLTQYVNGLVAMQEQHSGEITVTEEDGIRVRAAARCGWFGDGLDEDGVDDLYGWQVDELSDKVTEAFNEALTVPKN